MLAHFLAFFVLLGSTLLVVVGLGFTLFALAQGNPALAGRAAMATLGLSAAYLGGTILSALTAPTRQLPAGRELSFCGFDCHLHVSVAGTTVEGARIGVMVRVRSDASEEPEYPRYLQFRLVGSEGTILSPEHAAEAFRPTPPRTGEQRRRREDHAVPHGGDIVSRRLDGAVTLLLDVDRQVQPYCRPPQKIRPPSGTDRSGCNRTT